MYYNNNFSNSFFTKGHRTLTWGTVLLGAMLFFLAILIFVYPALIAYFIAAIILFAGLSALAIGLKLWQFRNEVTKLERMDDEPFHYRSPGTSRSHITYIRW
ncbi:MAG: hypothetical protein H8E32_11975 [Nitrospinae bacterium]|nr:hypothetical protein [Nitrospinota bacterium]